MIDPIAKVNKQIETTGKKIILLYKPFFQKIHELDQAAHYWVLDHNIQYTEKIYQDFSILQDLGMVNS